jgi:hypothetical protein
MEACMEGNDVCSGARMASTALQMEAMEGVEAFKRDNL